MRDSSNHLKHRTTFTYATIILSGALLSGLVFFNAQQVERLTLQLIDQQIPTLSLIKQLNAALSEQERVVYEYYATDDSSTFEHAFSHSSKEIDQDILKLASIFQGSTDIPKLQAQQQQMVKLAIHFDGNMRSNQTDWDLAREILTEITRSRMSVKPSLTSLEALTAKNADTGYYRVIQQLNNTNLIVVVYSLAILIIALMVGRYIQGYLDMLAKSRRLALVSERNPNPILSINDSSQVSYYNPATMALLGHLQLKPSQVDHLIPKDFLAMKKKLACDDVHFVNFEQTYQDRTYNCQLHWLKDINNYDLHFTDITSRKQAERKLSYQAFHVQETGLFNKLKLVEDINFQIANQQTCDFLMGLVELRKFNHIVAASGITAAEKVIAGLTDKLIKLLKQQNGSWQADLYQINESTFAILVNGQAAQAHIEDIYFAIEQVIERPLMTPYGEFSIELDMGFCRYPEHGDCHEALLQHARMALDEAIATEHTSLVMYCDRLCAKLDRATMLSQLLRKALSNNEFELYFQPQLAIRGNSIVGMETLIRWQNKGEFISPAEFIPLAEQTGLIIPIGEWILQQACQTAMVWRQQGNADLTIAVNISPRQFRHPGFINLVSKSLKVSGLPAKHLELEITEGVIMHDEKDTIAVLHSLKQLGVQLSIDDFGTGYSSLSYLKRFPIDKLKVDQSFVKDMHTNAEDKAIIRTIVELGKNLGLKLIAEGVEEQAHYEYLVSIGCDEIQGYWLSKPLPADQVYDFLIDSPKAAG